MFLPNNSKLIRSVEVYISGGEPPYQFLWSDGIEFNNGNNEYCSGGEYAVTVTDSNNSMVTASFEAVEYQNVVAVLSPTMSLNCDGLYGVGIDVLTGIPPYEYSWNGGDFSMSAHNNLSAGTHTIVVRDSVECTGMLEFDLDEPLSLIEVDITVSGNTATATVSGGVPPYTYQWNDPNAQTTSIAVGLDEGIYSVTVTGANGCEATAEIDLTVGINTPEYLTNFDIFPNPSNGKFTIDLQFEVTQNATIQLLNSLGQEVYQFTDTQSHFLKTVEIYEAAAGIYFVVIYTESGHVARRVVLR